jgi:hypothetical protein
MDDKQTKLNRFIERLELFQTSNKLSDVRFVARFQRFLGSTKTWRQRICARNWADLAGADGEGLDSWISKLSSLVAELDGGTDLQAYLDNLPISAYAQLMYERLQGQSSDRRCCMLVANYGCGKSWALRRIRRNNLAETVMVEADVSWIRSWGPIANALADAIGSPKAHSGAQTFANVIEYLKIAPMTLLVDEAHEGGVYILKMLKTIINETRSRVIIATYPTGWNKLTKSSNDAYQEARQLLGRTIKPIETRWVKGVTEDDVAVFLAGYCRTLSEGEANSLARRITARVRDNGNLRLLSDAIDNALLLAEHGNQPLTSAHVEQAVTQLCDGGKLSLGLETY